MAEIQKTSYLGTVGLGKLISLIGEQLEGYVKSEVLDGYVKSADIENLEELGKKAEDILELVEKLEGADLTAYALKDDVGNKSDLASGLTNSTIVAAINSLKGLFDTLNGQVSDLEDALGTGDSDEDSVMDRLEDIETTLDGITSSLATYATKEELKAYATTTSLAEVLKNVTVASDGYNATDKTVTLSLEKFGASTDAGTLTLNLKPLFDAAKTTDQFLENVTLDKATGTLTFTFAIKGEGGKTDIPVNLGDYIKPYDVNNASNADVVLALSNENKFSATLSADVLAKLEKADKLDADSTYVTTDDLEGELEDYAKAEDLDKYVTIEGFGTELNKYVEAMTAEDVKSIWDGVFNAED